MSPGRSTALLVPRKLCESPAIAVPDLTTSEDVRWQRLKMLALQAMHDRVSRPGEFHPEPLSEPDLNVSAHTAPAMEPRRTAIVQWANNFGARREIRAIQCAARRL